MLYTSLFSPHRTLTYRVEPNSCGDIRVEMIPYSRSPSATYYNSLYLPLLNLEEKMDSEKKLVFFTDT